jgi:hypothetical protein
MTNTETTTVNACCDICTLNHATGQHFDKEFAPVKVKAFRRADLTDAEKADINLLWHLSRIESHGRHARMSYVVKWFRKRHQTDYSDKALWLAVDEETQLVRSA